MRIGRWNRKNYSSYGLPSPRCVFVQTYEPLQKLEDRLKEHNFFRCHKGFIINPDMVVEIIPWGNKTYLVKLANTKETALMTWDHVKEFQKRYCV
ncbi:Hypothetical protein LUCI_0336 [Lucifera butyrica]|uniref:HTH LytTR-type domain-containing protein n=1 Tax=Lucifera butyrica TaxID=1351585 RepID=A0A498R1U8_9FIRM|nr:LytTR family DNA-binding domain-containing protein [Lucifera butyrica]VBB05129.1 Hypothetical protein LUCI_0336 [Lucifera butyrica]